MERDVSAEEVVREEHEIDVNGDEGHLEDMAAMTAPVGTVLGAAALWEISTDDHALKEADMNTSSQNVDDEFAHQPVTPEEILDDPSMHEEAHDEAPMHPVEREDIAEDPDITTEPIDESKESNYSQHCKSHFDYS